MAALRQGSQQVSKWKDSVPGAELCSGQSNDRMRAKVGFAGAFVMSVCINPAVIRQLNSIEGENRPAPILARLCGLMFRATPTYFL
jgi:hypothetical protein